MAGSHVVSGIVIRTSDTGSAGPEPGVPHGLAGVRLHVSLLCTVSGNPALQAASTGCVVISRVSGVDRNLFRVRHCCHDCAFWTRALWRRTRSVRIALGVFLLALLWCAPYLFYMHSATGKVFYWATSVGSDLYWISTPYAGEYGSWFSSNQVRDRNELAPHREFFTSWRV